MYNAIAFILGLFTGLILSVLIYIILRKTNSYVGIMKIIREEDKLVYSLELHEDPIVLEGMNEIIFKVESSDKSSNRE